MSRCKIIRDYLRDKPPMGSAAIAAAIRLPAFPVQHSIGNMVQSGILKREGVGRCLFYSLAREIVTVRFTPEERRARRAARERERYAGQVKRSRAEWYEYLAKSAAERKQAAAERKAQRYQEQRERMAALNGKRAKARKPIAAKAKPTEASRIFIVPAKPQMTVAAKPKPKPKPKAESVAEWMLRTGNRPEVLPVGAVSQPLKLIGGQHAIGKKTWERRMARAA